MTILKGKWIIKVNLTLLLALAGLTEISPVQAESIINYLAVLKGECLSATVDETDFTASCTQGKAWNFAYKNGRASFGFATGNNTRMSFVGDSDSQPSAEEYHLHVVGIATSIDAKVQLVAASVDCTILGDPTKKATLTCDATTEKNEHFHVVFEINGEPYVVHG